jgi:hypothetical protein
LNQNGTMDAYSGGLDTEVDVEVHPTAKKLLSTCRKFFSEIDNLYVPLSPIHSPILHVQHTW